MSRKDKTYTDIKEFEKIKDIATFTAINMKKKNTGLIFNLMKYLLSIDDLTITLKIYYSLIDTKLIKWRHAKIILSYILTNNSKNVSEFYLSYVKPHIQADSRVISFLMDNIPNLLVEYLGKPIILNEKVEPKDYCLKKIPVNQEDLMKRWTDYIKSKVEDIRMPEFYQVIAKVPSDSNLMIDGNNILLTKGGKITNETIKFYHQIIENVSTFNYITFIHRRHKKNLVGKISFDNVLFTPKGFDDDWFTICSAIIKKCYLFSDDNYRNHIYNIGSDDLKIFFQDYQIKSDKDYTKIIMPLKYSKVIQEQDNHIYIPAINGFKCIKL